MILISYATLWEKLTEIRHFMHPSPTMYIYFYTTQQNKIFTALNRVITNAFKFYVIC